MENREPRVKVSVSARMRVGIDWSDVHIENLSSRGLMLKGKTEVKRGSYVEIRHGSRIIVGRVVWARGMLTGLRAQDRIDIGGILGTSRQPKPLVTPPDGIAIDRRDDRTRPDPQSVDQRAERSRRFGNAFQFVGIGTSVAIGCVVLATVVGDLLGDVSSTVRAALG